MDFFIRCVSRYSSNDTIFSVFRKSDTTEDDIVRADLNKYSKTLPQRIDEMTVLDSLTISPKKVINYYYTIGISKEEADYKSIEENVNGQILNTIKSSSELENLRKLSYTWHYTYYDKNRQFFHEYTVTPDMYKD